MVSPSRTVTALRPVSPSRTVSPCSRARRLDTSAGDAGGNSRHVSDADAVANRGDGMSPRGENSENHTNEAKFDESVTIIQNKDPVGVAANSGVDSGLDKRQEQPWRAEGKDASDHVPDGSFGLGDGERDSFEPSIDWDALPDPTAQPGCGTGTAGATQSASANMMADTTLVGRCYPFQRYQRFGQCHPFGRYHPAGGLGA